MDGEDGWCPTALKFGKNDGFYLPKPTKYDEVQGRKGMSLLTLNSIGLNLLRFFYLAVTHLTGLTFMAELIMHTHTPCPDINKKIYIYYVLHHKFIYNFMNVELADWFIINSHVLT